MSKQLRNFDNVEANDFETYMKAGICEFWAIVNPYNEESTQLKQLADKYGYGAYTTKCLDMYEVIKRGATFQDRTRQIQNGNISLYC